ncbi:MAG: rRNA pseudouridine synthase [Clostridia bacterium]|nr:rRNA pseudouridine synthase [Clostridia bacterium]
MERLQKILSTCGICSRRAAEKMIDDGRVTVNGEVAHLGQSADIDNDIITVDGKLIAQPKKTYIMLNKPRGFITTSSDEKGRRCVVDLIDLPTRVYPVGRLDYNSEGLLILTNDGALTQQLTHPSHEIGKQYIVTVKGDVDEALTALRLPFVLDGRETIPAQAQVLRETAEGGTLSITIYEGRNRQIRRMCEMSGLEVVRLKRVAIGKLEMSGLRAGEWRHLTDKEVAYLKGLKR